MPFSLLQPLCEIPLAFVDTETTGASAEFGHRVIELGIVRVENCRPVAEYQQLIDPERRISPGVTALTGISQQMVAGQPTFAQQLPAAMELLRGAILIGHNVRFDLSFLRKELRRCDIQITDAFESHVLDTVRIARRRFGRGGNGLQTLAPRLGIQPAIAHRALADAQTTHLLFEKMLEPLAGWRTSLADILIAQGGPMGLLPVSPRESLLPLELEEALERRKPVLMEYLDGNQHRTERIIEPLTIRRSNGELIMVAHCHLRAAQRTFKVERIVQLRRIEPTQPPIPAAPSATIPLPTIPLPTTAPIVEISSPPSEPSNAAPPLVETLTDAAHTTTKDDPLLQVADKTATEEPA
jgi:DNA polymerase-3 subunit epsilon